MTMQETKPSYEEWMYWIQVVIDRLSTIVHVYNKPPFEDVFMPQADRQNKTAQTVDILRALHTLTDEPDIGPLTNSGSGEEKLIDQIEPLLNTVMEYLPGWSSDMQLLLKSPWYDRCSNHRANELFRGPQNREAEGIGSGRPEHGRLPLTLMNLLERERLNDTRAPREERPKTSDPKLRRIELARLWARHNTSFLRSAGRVD